MKKQPTQKKQFHPKPNWLGWIKWMPLVRDYTIVCCDCGLAHRFQIRVVKGKVQWRAKRDKENTKLARNKFKPSKTVKKSNKGKSKRVRE